MTKNIDGLDELMDAFDALSDAGKGEVLANAAMSGGNVVATEAKERITEQKLILTGTLRRSVHAELVSATETQAMVEIGTNIVYGPLYEFGGINRGRYVQARPYLRPALEENHDKIREEMAAAFVMQIKQVWK